ncbi:MAG: UDP-N-acetylmuramate--L-alanine ligase [Thermodesulfovibrionales bacterium]|nr:UDP-N-acetylmuramate--L-alanine ligase [Thermodesulfovibrionales bacterium]
MFEHYRVIHFTGIGGIGMSGIAEVLLNLGYEVTGSDLKESETTERLRRSGAKIHIGHRPGNVAHAHVVVISSAVSTDNIEVREARRRSIPVIPRAEMLAELGRLKYSVLVAGAHGKTTTTSLISTVLAHAGLDPTAVIGGKLKAIGTNAKLGRGEFLVAEADESDGSFLKLSPAIGVVTNIDREHMEFFKTMDALKEAFLSFMNKVPFYGVAVLCSDNEHIRQLLPLVHRRTLTYGLSKDAELRAHNIKRRGLSASFDVALRGKNIGRFRLSMPGIHNILNSLAAVAVAIELRVGVKKIQEALSGFEGIQRRLEFKGRAKGVRFYDDYGHHPTEIRATVGALKESFPKGRLHVIFQPHRYSRTKSLFEEFTGCFMDADALYLMDIYPAGEKPIKGITSKALYMEIKKAHARVSHFADKEELIGSVLSGLSAEDTVLTLGAGDVWKTGEQAISRLMKQALSRGLKK